MTMTEKEEKVPLVPVVKDCCMDVSPLIGQ
jgi:hypothetical protein